MSNSDFPAGFRNKHKFSPRTDVDLQKINKPFPPSPAPRSPEEEEAWINRLEEQRRILSAGVPNLIDCEFQGEEEDGSEFTLIFSAYVLSSVQLNQRTVELKFSNGVTLRKVKVKP